MDGLQCRHYRAAQKKLKAAARRLAGRDTPPQIDDEAARAAIAMGIPQAEVVAARTARKIEPLAVWPENWRPVGIASGMHTQWRMGPAGPIGWDYNALPIVEARIDAPAGDDPADEFRALQVIEGEMLQLLREKNG